MGSVVCLFKIYGYEFKVRLVSKDFSFFLVMLCCLEVNLECVESWIYLYEFNEGREE